MGEIADWLTDIGEAQAAKYDMAHCDNAKLSDERLVEATEYDEDGEPFEGIML